jgi:hypothetical protein
LRPLDFRRAAAFEIAKMASLIKSVEDRIAFLRLERDRAARLKAELHDAELFRAIEYLDLAVMELATIQHRLEGKS